MSYFIYILECRNGNYYTGYTTNLVRRYQEHLAGSYKCKYTRSFPPLRIAASWEIPGNLAFTLKIENSIKKLPKAQKIKLISHPELLKSITDWLDR